jgi:hypothetical protein
VGEQPYKRGFTRIHLFATTTAEQVLDLGKAAPAEVEPMLGGRTESTARRRGH